MIGQTFSHYRIIKEIGKGGMGVVYLAEDTVLGRQVAIKTLTEASGTGNQNFRIRFLREARAVSALSHPHIATIHDYGETPEGQPYIVMEFIRGETLGDLMLKESLTIPRAIEIISEVAEALAEAHAHGIIHRDIKPSNIAINHRGEVKVLDFGLAKQIDPGIADSFDPERQTLLNTQTREGVIVGTPMYLSPEQALGLEVDARSDLFSLGGVLYECLAGKPPFFGGSPMEICAKVIRDDPAPPSQVNSHVPRELDRIALKSLAKKPDERYQTAGELLGDLQAARPEVHGFDQTITRTINAPQRTQPTGALATLSDIFKRPRLSIGYVAAGIVLISLIAFGTWRVRRPIPHQPTPQAQRFYDRGVDAIREGAFFRASKLLEQAVQEDDQFALAHARLAEAWTELDSTDKAKDALIRATDLVLDRSVLPELDSLRMEAVKNTVKRDFPEAVENYQALVAKAADSEKAFAFVDLGRAYEKNEQSDKAMESHQQATKLDSRYAAAFLRLGIVTGRLQRFDRAYQAFDQANKLFDIANEIEGMTQVLLQRAVLLGQQGNLKEARKQLLQAEQKSSVLENKDKLILVLLNLSNTELQAGDPTEAERYSSRALELARTSGLESLTMQGLIDQGNVFLIKGNFSESDKRFNEALRLAQLYKGRRSEARAFLALASSHSQQGDLDGARQYFQQALPFYEIGGYRKEIFQAYVMQGRYEARAGNYDVAQQRFDQLLSLAQQVNDLNSEAFAHEGLGRVFLTSQNFPKALVSYTASYQIAKSLNLKLSIGYTAANRAEVLWQLGQYAEAQTALAEAREIATPRDQDPNTDLLSQVLLINAWLLLSEKRPADALHEAKKSLLTSGTQSKTNAIEAAYALGLAEAQTGQAAIGRKRCEDAVGMARSVGDVLLLSKGLLALSEAALLAGDKHTALKTAAEAKERTGNAKQLDFLWRAWLIEARASEGSPEHARSSAQQASDYLATLETEWGAESFKDYLGRQDVQEARIHISRILGSP